MSSLTKNKTISSGIVCLLFLFLLISENVNAERKKSTKDSLAVARKETVCTVGDPTVNDGITCGAGLVTLYAYAAESGGGAMAMSAASMTTDTEIMSTDTTAMGTDTLSMFDNVMQMQVVDGGGGGGGGTTYTVNWYYGTGDHANHFAQGNSITVDVSYTTTYYVAVYALGPNGGCWSNYVPVTAYVNATTSANAGPDQMICNSISATLAANAPPGQGAVGSWSVVSGPSTALSQFSAWYDPNATFTRAGGYGNYVLQWSFNACGMTSDNVTISFNQPPTIDAGPNQVDGSTCGKTSVTLAAKTSADGIYKWILSPDSPTKTGYSFSSNSPNATFSGTPGAYYSLQWTLLGGASCGAAATTDVKLNVYPTSTAGSSQSICGTVSTTLNATPPAVGTGSWSVSGPSSASSQFSSTTNPAATFSPAGGLGTYVLTWTVTTLYCGSASSSINLVFNPLPSNPTAGLSNIVCSGVSTILSPTLGANSNSLQWYDSNNQFVTTAPSITLTNPTANSSYTVYGYNSTTTCRSSSGASLSVTVRSSSPTTPVAIAPMPVFGHGQVSMQSMLGQPCSTCLPRWFSAATGGTPLGTGMNFTTPDISGSTPFYVSTYDTYTTCESPRILLTANVLPIVTPLNVQTDVIRVSGITQDNQIYSLTDVQKNTSFAYIDGLSRTSQMVGVRMSPQGKDMVQPMEYDSYGRTSKDYLPYVAGTTTGAFQNTYVASQSAFYNSPNDKIADDASPFALASYENSPLGRVLEKGGVGQAWQPGTGHTTLANYSYNTGASANNDDVEEVRQFNSDGSSSGFYAANLLSRTAVTDENGNTDITFTDGLGHTIVRKQQLNGTINGQTVNYLQTYYVYDDLNRLKYIIPPGGQAALKSNSWVLSQTIIDQYLHQFVYDSRGRLTQKKTPGQAWTYFIYDNLNRVVLTQDGNLRPLNKWAFVKYDNKGRTVMSGLYTNTTQTDYVSMNNLMLGQFGSGTPYFEERGTALHGYTNNSFPKTNADNSPLEVYNVAYFDGYDFDYNGSDDYTYTSQGITGEGSQGSSYGMPTGSKKLVLGTTTWLYTYAFYDLYGRPIQTRSNNHLSTTADNLTTVVYDFEGKVLQTKTYHNAGGANQTTTVQTPSYDIKGRLTQINHSINGAQSMVLAQYNYNELGQVVQKNLHCANCSDPLAGQSTTVFAPTIQRSAYSSSEQALLATQMVVLNTGYHAIASGSPLTARIVSANPTVPSGGGQFLQNVDYRYNIKGWLTSINNAQLTNDNGVTNNDVNDYFGMELNYNTDAGVSNTLYYNGNVSAVKWKNAGATSGATGQKSYAFAYDKTDKLLSATFQKYGTSAWNVEQGSWNEAMTYDHNGNVLTLQRNQNQHSLSGTTVSSTAQTIDNLTYTYASPNQLSKVTDASTTAGFNDTANQTTEYSYDTHGNLTSDVNKGISAITYNALGKAQQITFSNGNVVTYTYDGGGNKLTMVSTVSGATTTTNYVSSFVYNTTGTTSTLNFFSSPEGRVVKNTKGNLEYQYAITDHQGNTRVVFSSAPAATQSVTAGFESANQTSEASNFSNYQTGAHINNIATNAHTGTSSLWLNGGYAGQVGVAKTYKVFPGDQLSIQAYAKYSANSGSSNLAGFASALLTAFNLATPAPGELGTPSAALNTFGGLEATGWGDGTNDNTDPKVFVNIVLFDQNYKFLDVTYAQLKSSGALMTTNYTVKEAGYAYLYVSNENPTLIDVYFDDVTMSYTPTNIVQSNDYYPFGLQHSTSWTRDNATNNFLYDGGSELNTTTALYDLPYRNYDPTLGRFFQVDPMAHKTSDFTPYHYAANNPLTFSDPSGLTLKPIPPPPTAGYGGGGWWEAMLAFAANDDSGFEDDPYADFGRRENVSDDMFPSPYKQRQQMEYDAQNMSVTDFAAKYGVTFGGGAAGAVAAMAYLHGSELSISTVLAQIGGTLYGGQAFYNDGVLTGVAVSQARLSSNGAYEKVGDEIQIDMPSSTRVNILSTAAVNPGPRGPIGGPEPWYGNFLGPGADANPYNLRGYDGKTLRPVDMLDQAAQKHDYAYYNAMTGGVKGALFNTQVRNADKALALTADLVIMYSTLGIKDHVSGKPVTAEELKWALGVSAAFSSLGMLKHLQR